MSSASRETIGLAAARIRIGRVTMKEGGADLRVLSNPAVETESGRKMQEFARDMLSASAPYHGFAAVAFRVEPTCPGGMDTLSVWASDRAEVQYSALPVMVCEVLRRHMTLQGAEIRVMRALGYRYDDDPDPAA